MLASPTMSDDRSKDVKGQDADENAAGGGNGLELTYGVTPRTKRAYSLAAGARRRGRVRAQRRVGPHTRARAQVQHSHAGRQQDAVDLVQQRVARLWGEGRA